RIDAVEARTVAEMEARDRIDRPSLARTGEQEVVRGGRTQKRLHFVHFIRVPEHVRLIEERQRMRVRGLEHAGAFGLALAREPAPELRRGRERDEIRELRKFARDFLHHLLDEETPERNAAEAP